MITPTKSPYLISAAGMVPLCNLFTIINAMSNQATFVETFTVEQFKAEVGTSKIELIKSPKTGKYFIADAAGNSVAAVSTKISQASDLTDPVVSQVIGDDGEEFYLMHNRGTGGNASERSW